MSSGELYQSRKLQGKCPTCGDWPAPGHITCDACIERTQKSRERNIEAYLWRLAKDRAEKKGIPFTITPEDIVIPTHCPVFGTTLARGVFGKGDASPTLDKLIPELGYIPGNVFVVSERCNRLKSDSTLEELEKIVKYIYSKLNNTPA